MKTEPETYSINQLKMDKTTLWEGVRNYQARNFMVKQMKLGDKVLIYHSNAKPSGIVGLGKVSKLAQPDPSAFDKKSKYFDPKSKADKPTWFCVEVEFVIDFKKMIPLEHLKRDPQLKELLVIKKGQRLSIQPMSEKDFNYICQIADP